MTDDPTILEPNREMRRHLADRPCCACDTALRSDALGVRTDDAVLWMHGACIRQLLQNATAEPETEES